MKKFLSALCIIGIFGFVLYWFGSYPIASVNGTLIFFRTWQRTMQAEKQVVNVRAHASHTPLVDFSSPKSSQLLDVIRRSTLTFLIDSALMREEGSRVVPDLEQLSVERVDDELRKSKLTEEMATAVYGLDLATLKETILVPHARQEIVDHTLDAEHKDFADWLLDVRGRAHVRFFFVPFRWDRAGVQ